MSGDPTAAERARRYRARHRDVTEQHADDLHALVVAVGELVDVLRANGAQPVGNRDAGARHAPVRDVTDHHAGEGAPARAHVTHDDPAPTAPRIVDAVNRDVTPVPVADGQVGIDELLGPHPAARPLPPLELELLEALTHSPATVDALADAVSAGVRPVLEALIDLQRQGRVRRVAGETPRDRDRWRLEVDATATVRCVAYHAHSLAHRRDPATGGFRCYVCDPEGRPTSATEPAGTPASA